MNKCLLLCCSLLLLSGQAVAQPDYCFDFEDVPLGTQYGPGSGASPGDVVFTGPGAQASLQEIIYPDGSTGFLNAEIYGDGVGWLDNQFILLGNNSLVFDFAGIPGGVTQVCFDYFDGGGNENFSVNGSPVAILNFLSEVGQLSIPGIAIDVSVAGNTFLEEGTICITGDIRSLLIGGQELGLDNICYRQAGPIANLRAEIVGCDSAGNYDILVDFDWLSPLTVIAFFDIFIDGMLEASNISQLDFPYLLQGVQPVTDALEFELTVCQHNVPDVCASVILSKDCPPGSGCVEFEGLSQSSYGSSAGTPPGTPFYTENDVSLLLIPFQSLFWTTTYGNLLVLDAEADPAMTAASGQYLKFESINAVIDLAAYPEPADSATVDFYYAGGAVNLAANGANILIQNSLQGGTYNLAPTATLEVAFEAPNALEGQLIFRGALQSLLIGGNGDFRIDNLCINPTEPEPEPCALSNLSIRPVPCGITGDLFVEIDFDYQGVSDSFALFSDAGASTHAYGELPLTVGPIPAANAQVYAFFIRDQDADLDCALSDTLHIVNCTGCGFDGLTVGYLGQNAAGQTLIEWDFTLNATNGDNFYSVYIDDELLGRYEWSQVPWRTAVPCPTSNQPPLLTICSGDSSCCVSVPLAFVQPCPPACALSNLQVQAGPCNPNGVFSVHLDLDYQGASDTFELWLNGNATGLSYAYSDLPLALPGPFLSPTPQLEFTAVDSADPDCRASAVLPPVNCFPCPSIDSVSYYLTPCTGTGFYLVIDEVILASPASSSVFWVSANNALYGPFSLGNLPVEIGPLAPNTVYQIAVFTQNTAACAYTFNVGPVSCPGACPLEAVELAAEPQCDPNSTQYRVKLRVAGLPAGGVLTVQSAITGASVAAVLLPNGLLELQLPIPPMMVDSLVICTSVTTPITAPCCLAIGFDVDCQPPCTVIEDVRYEVSCNDDGTTFDLFIKELLYAPLIPLDFSVFVNGEYFGPFNTMQLPVSTGPFASDSTIYEVLVTENTTNACGFYFTLGPVVCPPPCPIQSAAVVGTPSCSNVSGTQYQAVFVIQGAQEGDVFVVKSLLSGTTATGTYANGALVVQLPNTSLGYDKVRICLLDNPANTAASLCCIELEYDVNCPPLPCPWGNIVVEPGDCHADGTYYAELNLILTNPAMGGSFIVVSGDYQAAFQIADLPVRIGPFQGDGQLRTVTVLVSNTNCTATVVFQAPDCSQSGACELTLNAEPRPCDGDQFKVGLQVQASNPGALGYLVFANGQLSGPYSYSQTEVLLGPFAGDGSTVYNFLVLDLENPTCFAYAEAGPVDCANACAITALAVEALGCNDDGSYNLAIDLQVENPSSNVLQVFTANGVLVGGYSLDSLPIIVAGFPASSANIGRLKVCVLGSSPDCCAVAEFDLPDCSPQDSSCVGFEPFAGFISPPNDGGQGRVPLGTESGVDIEYFIADFCNCFVKVVDAATVPFFAAGNGQVLEFQQASLFFGFPATAQEVSFDYAAMPGTTGILLNINDSTSLGILLDTLPLGQVISLPNGNTIKRILLPNSSPNANSFRIIIQGAIDELALWGAGFLDNLCYELAGACAITALEVQALGCNEDGTQNLLLGLAVENPGSDSFEVLTANGALLGTFNLESLPVVVTNFPPSSSLVSQLKVCIPGSSAPACCETAMFTLFNCNDSSAINCIGFDVFDNLQDTIHLGGPQADEVVYAENGVLLWSRAIPWPGSPGYFGGILAYAEPLCGGFSSEGGFLVADGGLEFDFSGLPALPVEVSMEIGGCGYLGINMALSVNGDTYSGPIFGLPATLGGAEVEYLPLSSSLSHGKLTIAGTVEKVMIGSIALAIDNVCYALEPQLQEVWPGDANADNIANHIDLLSVGLAYGAQGPARFDDSNDWSSFYAQDWTQFFADGLNYKHADCNGDGTVNASDRDAIVQNYGLTHGPLAPPTALPGTDFDPPVFVDFPPVMPDGAAFNVPIVIGSVDAPAQDIYGIAFTVEFDPQVIDPQAIEVTYPVSWFGQPNVNTLYIDRTYAAEGQIEIALTRTDQNNVSGYGPVAFIIGIIDDIAGLVKSDVQVSKIKAIRNDEKLIPLGAPLQSFAVEQKAEPLPEDPELARGIFSVFPNPTTDWVTVTSRHGFKVDELRLMNAAGELLPARQEGRDRVSLEGLPAGLYILRIRSGETLVHKKVVKY